MNIKWKCPCQKENCQTFDVTNDNHFYGSLTRDASNPTGASQQMKMLKFGFISVPLINETPRLPHQLHHPSVNVRQHLTWAEDKQEFKVPESGGRVEIPSPSCSSSRPKIPVTDGLGLLSFLAGQRSAHHLPGAVEALHASLCWFHSPTGFGPILHQEKLWYNWPDLKPRENLSWREAESYQHGHARLEYISQCTVNLHPLKKN